MDKELEGRIREKLPGLRGGLRDYLGDVSIIRCRVCGEEAKKIATLQQYTHLFWVYECRDRHIFAK